MRPVPPTYLAFLISAALTLGACSSGGSSGSGSSSSGVEVGFPFGTVAVGENVGLVIATLMLSEARADDTSVNFVTLSPPFPTPVATFNLDFQVLTPSPLLIPAGSVSANISIVILNDTDGELDEGFVIRLVSATDTEVGSNSDFFVTIQDDDAIAFPETEPNDPAAMADSVGVIGPGTAFQITGTIDAAALDFFSLTTPAAADVWIELTPLTTGPDVVLTITDPMGNDVVVPVNDNGPGEFEFILYPAAAGETFLIEVFNTFTGGMYRMKVVGLTPANPIASPVEATRAGVWVVDMETGEAAWVEETVVVER